ncbi:MAG: hypothetical protein K2Q20_02070 [Phycisphaerales bacterium]|nr:hypothetical protein [Phycisphaerales bacterium]
MADPVEKLVMIVAAAEKRGQQVKMQGLGALLVWGLEFWIDSRVLGIGLWAVISAFFVFIFWGSGMPLVEGLIAPLGGAAAFLLTPWLYFRWRFRSERSRQVRAMEAVFASARVNAAQWAEAKRLIRQAEPGFFRCGHAGHLDDWAAKV